MGEGGIKNGQKNSDIFYGWPLRQLYQDNDSLSIFSTFILLIVLLVVQVEIDSINDKTYMQHKILFQ